MSKKLLFSILSNIESILIFVSDVVFTLPSTPINMHIDNSLEITKVKRQAYGPAGYTDPFAPDVVTLLNFDSEVDFASTFTDEIPNTWSIYGRVRLASVTGDPAGYGGMYDVFGGGEGAHTDTVGMSAGDYTIELRVKFGGTDDFKAPIVWGNYQVTYSDVLLGQSRLLLWNGATDAVIADVAQLRDNWHDIIVQRVSGITYLYLDTTLLGSTATMNADLSTLAGGLTVGTQHAGAQEVQGYIDAVRITLAARPIAPIPDRLGSSDFGGSTWDTLYTATYVSDEILLNDVALFTVAGLTDFDLDFDGDGYPVVSYTTVGDSSSGVLSALEGNMPESGLTAPIVDQVLGDWVQPLGGYSYTPNTGPLGLHSDVIQSSNQSQETLSNTVVLGNNGYVIEGWFVMDDASVGHNRVLAYWGVGNFALYYRDVTDRIHVWNGTSAVIDYQVSGTFTDDVWRFYQLHVNATGIATLYISETGESPTLVGTATIPMVEDFSTPITMHVMTNPNGGERLNGLMADFKITSGSVPPYVPTAPLNHQVGGLSNYTHQDTTHTFIDASATNPFIVNELPEDVGAGLVVGYESGTNAAYRLSHESYATERIAADLTGGGVMEAMGMVDDGSDKRLAMKFTPPASEV